MDGSESSGKIFVIKLLLAKVYQENKTALAIAISGIIATLRPRSRTARSLLKLPLDLSKKEDPVCDMSRSFAIGKLIKICYLNVWNECTMEQKKAFKAVDRRLRNMRNCNSMMENITVFL